MQLSTRGRYAVMAMADLATRNRDQSAAMTVSLADIAERQQLSQSYLEQLFGKLRRAGLVGSARGPGGGYRLARPAGEIAIADIVAAVDEPTKATRCDAGRGGCLLSPSPGIGNGLCQTHELWVEAWAADRPVSRGHHSGGCRRGRVTGRAAAVPPSPADPAGVS